MYKRKKSNLTKNNLVVGPALGLGLHFKTLSNFIKMYLYF